MKIMNLVIGLSGLLLAAQAQAYAVNPAKSKVTWMGSKIVGETHTGNVKLKSADLKWKKGVPQSGKIVIDMTTITNTDVKSEKWNQKLVGHLKSDDFFSVDKHKTAELVIKNVQKANDKFYLITGTLQIKGKTQPITVRAEVKKNSKAAKVVTAKFSFDRTKFGIKYGSGQFFTDLGDKMISDEVEVAIDLHIDKKTKS